MQKLLETIFAQVILENQIIGNCGGTHAVGHEAFDQPTALAIGWASDEKIDIRMGAEIASRQRAYDSYNNPVAFSGAQNSGNGC